MNAQRARGVDFGEGNLVQKMKAVIPLLIPLFVSSFNRAEDLATAMEARGYKGGKEERNIVYCIGIIETRWLSLLLYY